MHSPLPPPCIKPNADLPDLCVMCGTNPPDPELVEVVDGILTNWQGHQVRAHLELCFCPACYARLDEEKREVGLVRAVQLALAGLGSLGLATCVVQGLPALLYVAFALCLFLALYLHLALSLLYSTKIVGWRDGDLWFRNPTYEREFAERNPDLLTTERHAWLIRITSRKKKRDNEG